MPLAQSSPDRMECLKDTVIHAIMPLETYYKKGTGSLVGDDQQAASQQESGLEKGLKRRVQ